MFKSLFCKHQNVSDYRLVKSGPNAFFVKVCKDCGKEVEVVYYHSPKGKAIQEQFEAQRKASCREQDAIWHASF